MRHPTSDLNDDDLSRLTGSSLTTSPSSSSSSSSSTTPIHENETNNNNNISNNNIEGTSNDNCVIFPIIGDHHHHHHHHHFHHHHHNKHHCHRHHHHHHDADIEHKNKQNNFVNSSYLPEIIDPLDWHKSRKRKERQDSTSSTTQDRKLVRSNSEELISNSDHEVIRRVSSHEDFKKPLQEINNSDNNTNNILNTVETKNNHNENQKISGNNHQQQQQYTSSSLPFPLTNYQETSPARSYRFLINCDYNVNGGNSGNGNNNGNSRIIKDTNIYDCDYYEYEHEKRRSNERLCKSRANYSGRKIAIMRKSSKQYNIMSRYHPTATSSAVVAATTTTALPSDENTYKYDISSMKYERRGFVSKVKLEERNRKEEAADGEQIPQSSVSSAIDYNDNNLIDFHMHENNCAHDNYGISISQQQQQHKQTIAEALPWDSTNNQEQDQTPVLCRRFASIIDDNNDELNSQNQITINNQKSAMIINTNTENANAATQSLSPSSSSSSFLFNANDYPPPAVVIDNEPIKSFRTFTKMENLKTSEIMLQKQKQIIPPQTIFQQTPEERLKHINKKLQALKKRVNHLEEAYEKNYGYRPSQIEKFNDKQIKSVLAEIGKLRKEKHELKSDPITALGLKFKSGIEAEQRLNKMKDTLAEIEKKLIEKRQESNRSENLDELDADELMNEKAAIQHSLLYFESLYGRPLTREERDAARPLYDRYRVIKRMVTRSLSMSCGVGTFELPTILEHEAMAFSNVADSPTTAIQRHQKQYQEFESTENCLATATAAVVDIATMIISDHVPTLQSSPPLSSSSNVDSSTENSCSAESTTTESSNSTTTNGANTADTTIQQQQQQNSKYGNTGSGSLIENIHMLSIDKLLELLEQVKEEKKQIKRSITEYEILFEEQNGRKMLKSDRKLIDDTYTHYKQKKAKIRLLQALIKKHITN